MIFLGATTMAFCGEASLEQQDLQMLQKESAPVTAIAVVISDLLTALLALRAARRAGTQAQANLEVTYE